VNREQELAGQTVVVIGGSSGIGFETARRARSEGADIVLTGHQHQYERLRVDGMTYVVDGLGGALNRFNFAAIQPGSLVRYNATFGALFVEVFDGKLSFTFRNTHGDVVDRFDVLRDCRQPHTLVDAGP